MSAALAYEDLVEREAAGLTSASLERQGFPSLGTDAAAILTVQEHCEEVFDKLDSDALADIQEILGRFVAQGGTKATGALCAEVGARVIDLLSAKAASAARYDVMCAIWDREEAEKEPAYRAQMTWTERAADDAGVNLYGELAR